MMKRTLIGALAFALALIGTACDSTTPSGDLEPPYVTTVAVSDGGALRLTWGKVDGASTYEIKTDDSVYTTTDTSFDVSTPTVAIYVRSVSGSKKSDSTALSCEIVESAVEFFADLDVAHANGFGFTDKGEVVACSLIHPSTLEMDFYADSSAGGIRLGRAVVNQNARGNALKAASVGYEGAMIADPLGTYSVALAIMADSTYYLRMSPDTSGTWSTADNFAKIRIDSIVGAKVSVSTAYQKIPGLRWLVK